MEEPSLISASQGYTGGHKPLAEQLSVVAALAHMRVENLHEHQSIAIGAILSGQDTMVCAPTGSGKTLCFVIPTLVTQLPTLVISPLVSLIRSQQKQLLDAGVIGTLFDSMQTNEDRDIAWQEVENGTSQIIWASPERLARPTFRERLGRLEIGLVAVDEAHCISQWGYHFRPEYRKIGSYINEITSAPRIALTATATPETQREIIEATRLRSPIVASSSPVRSNLALSVEKCKTADDQITRAVTIATSNEKTSLIYAPTRKKVEEIHSKLLRGGRDAMKFHGGMADYDRRRTINQFMAHSNPVMVATSSFGMGIDRSDIRTIIHVGFCQSIEQYTQEIGRAGRDGLPADCTMLYGPKDFFLQKFLLSRTFPDAHFLFECYALAKSILEARRWVNRNWIEQELRQRIEWGQDKSFKPDHAVAVDVLAREGLFLDLSNRDQANDENLITLGSEVGDEFWQTYESKRRHAMTKLRSVLNYAKLVDDHSGFIAKYFDS